MIEEDQTRVIDFLASPSTHSDASVERIDTHTAIVFLTGTLAYKLKRAVRFDYVDFSTSERRRAFCDAELRLNRRTAPTLYRRVLPVTRERDGSLALEGAGTAVDWLVEMNRFPQEALFDRLAAAGHLGLELIAPLADAIASFHMAAERRFDHGGRAGMAWVIEGNAAGFAEFGAACLNASAARRVTDDARRELDRRAALLDARREAGYVRECHGDLHLRNIVLIDGRPTLFDGVEFNDEISSVDTLYDVAFLLMDLWHRGLARHANVLWNRYLAQTGDLGGVSLLPLFLSCRAAVRAKTSATAAGLQNDVPRRGGLAELARDYLSMAERLLHPPNASLIAIGGFSGSGKSTVALGLAPSVGAVPGAAVLRSDEIRKRLCRVSPLDNLSPEGYSPKVSERVYARLAEHAGIIVRAGHTAIVDAVYAHPSDRQVIERVAADASVPFVGLWLDAAESIAIARAGQRRNDPSDADADVIRRQRAEGSGGIQWHRLDASASAHLVLQGANEYVAGRLRESTM
jgi:uncharacterized protein